MPQDGPANIYALSQSKVRERNKIGRPTVQFIEQISRFLTNDNRVKLIPSEITKYAINKRSWSSLIPEHQKPDG
ncbi:unnamed protein product [Brachionus calyciflorus]|uniref:Uncharacterized protein n=1 Tax=Brachionus calyciflorus TaxID=104777 RepID=A0A813XEN9_9BILA|nr:unnamed protein product [Brachionus calyciflorus]